MIFFCGSVNRMSSGYMIVLKMIRVFCFFASVIFLSYFQQISYKDTLIGGNCV